MKRALLQFICIFFLLVAQHGALVHAVWHGYRQLPLQQHEDDEHSPQTGLCDYHAALGEVLGGVQAPAAPHLVCVAVTDAASQPDFPFLPATPVAPASRGPPALL